MAKSTEPREGATFITSRDTIDGAYPGLILGINALRLGMDVSIFYTFMGINVIRKGWVEKAKFQPSGPMGCIPGMSSIATWMMKSKIDKANVPELQDLLVIAHYEGVKFFACQMTVDMMQLKKEDFIDGVVVQDAEAFLMFAKECKICLFT
ncbi:MAG TPA: DsrE/DsrF/DrsH-like family protein [Thermodesulfovibrionales bacterium]|nr:DsrE/DsrF/DrsH-like family protein [Thermodesulfovibrionales bacterium]